MTLTVQHFLTSKTAMELIPKEITHDIPALDRHSHAQPDSGWAHRIPMGNPPRRAAGERGGLVRAVPRMREPWPDTAEQWQLYALCSQLDADHRRIEERAARAEFRREITSMLKGAGTVLGIMAAVAVAYVACWWLWALVGA